MQLFYTAASILMKGAEVRYSISCEEFKKRGINELMHRFETRAELKA